MLLFLISLFYFLLVDYEFINAPLKQDFVSFFLIMCKTLYLDGYNRQLSDLMSLFSKL